VYGDTVTFGCNEGYELTASANYICNENDWQNLDDPHVYPKCREVADCGQPPQIDFGKLVSITGKGENAKALYSCNDGYRMVGNGFAVCKSTERLNEQDNMQFFSEWSFVPHCTKGCPIPQGKSGPINAAVLLISKCTTTSFSSAIDTTCETPNVVRLEKDVFDLNDVRFYGDEICVGLETVKEYKEVKDCASCSNYPTREHVKQCKGFCFSYNDGFLEVVTSDKQNYTSQYYDDEVTVEREIIRFEVK